MATDIVFDDLGTLVERFWAKVHQTDTCWFWTGATTDGYGRIMYKGRLLMAHCVSWELANRQNIPEGLWVLHSCDHHGCVNPDHLSVGTVQDNVDDMFAKGRNRWGAHRRPDAESGKYVNPRRAAEIKPGDAFGKWIVVERCEVERSDRSIFWVCRCECGKIRSIRGDYLRRGRATRCHRCAITKHGKARSPEYSNWKAMIQRCHRPKHREYHRYGGQGVAVCERWRLSFAAFFADMGARPGPKHEVDRIDNSKGYEPGNCRWATRAEQNRNLSRNRWFTHNGETLVITDWAARLGVHPNIILTRLSRGWSLEKALTTPADQRFNHKANPALLTFRGETLPLMELARRFGLSHRTVRARLRLGWSVEDAITTRPKSIT